jgi:hypothetical protein
LYIIPYVLFNTILVLKHDSISGYFYKPDGVNV